MSSQIKKKSGKVRGMGNISKEKRYAQVLLKKTDHEEMCKVAEDSHFPSLSAWAAAVLLSELKSPKHLKR